MIRINLTSQIYHPVLNTRVANLLEGWKFNIIVVSHWSMVSAWQKWS